MSSKKIKWGYELGQTWRALLHGVGVGVKILADVLITVLIIFALTGVIVGTVFTVYIKNYVDTEVDVSQFKLSIAEGTTTTSIYRYDFTDRSNRVGEEVLLEGEKIVGGSDSVYVTYDKIPDNMINAVIAIEDKRFPTHSGVDWIRTTKAGLSFFVGSGDLGGSTLTQQLIKNVTHNDEYKIQRKIQEIFWALDLETKMDKEEILEIYLNIVNFGSTYYGVQAAAYNYFSKDVSELTLIECAAIAGITQNPSKYNPKLYPENNRERRETVLYQMLDQGLITQREYEEAHGKELVLNVPGSNRTEQDPDKKNGVNSWYTDMVIEDVINDLMEQYGYTKQMASLMVYNGGLRIYSLVDPELQTLLEETFLDESNFPAYTSGLRAQSSGILIDPDTGDVLAVAGSRDKKTANRIQNFATQTKRPPGSSIKPLAVYSQAIEEGLINWGTVVDDTPFNFTSSKNGWPKNSETWGYYNYYKGLTDINYAVAWSLNTISVKVLDMVGLRRSFDFCKNVLQMDSLLESYQLSGGGSVSDIGYAALGLGQLNFGATVREMAAAYSIFANNGIFNECHSYLKVTDSHGDMVLDNGYSGTVAISEETASVMTLLMENVIKEGTASMRGASVEFGNVTGIDVAGKTGTAGDSYDRWFIGYTPYYICGLWYGYEYPKFLTGTNPCIPLFDDIMIPAHQKFIEEAAAGGEPLKTFDISPNIITCNYCADSGKLPCEICDLDPRGSRVMTGYFVKGTEPTQTCDVHVLVDYDTVTKGVACDYCPAQNVKKVALVRVDRHFPIEVNIYDAQYAYVELPYDTRPYSNKYLPYFYYLTVNSKSMTPYFGKTNGVVQYNAACTDHFDLTRWREDVARRQAAENAAAAAAAAPDLPSLLTGRLFSLKP